MALNQGCIILILYKHGDFPFHSTALFPDQANLGENQAGDLQLPWRVVDTPQKKQQYLDEYRGIPMRFQNIHNNPGLCLLTSTCSVALG